MARSTADFASTTSMIEGRLRFRIASRFGEDPEAAFLFSVIPWMDCLCRSKERGRGEEGREYDGWRMTHRLSPDRPP